MPRTKKQVKKADPVYADEIMDLLLDKPLTVKAVHQEASVFTDLMMQDVKVHVEISVKTKKLVNWCGLWNKPCNVTSCDKFVQKEVDQDE